MILAATATGAWRGGLKGAVAVAVTLFGYAVALWVSLTQFDNLARFFDTAFDLAGRIGRAVEGSAVSAVMVHGASFLVTRLVDDIAFVALFILVEIPFAVAAFVLRSRGGGPVERVNRILGAVMGGAQYLLVITLAVGLVGDLGGLPLVGTEVDRVLRGSVLAPFLVHTFAALLPVARSLLGLPV